MELLIIYSESKKGELVSLASLLHLKGIQFEPFALPRGWGLWDSEDLVQTMKNNSHWLFLIDHDDLANPALLFASGYGVAVHERCFVLDPSGLVPGYWKALFRVCSDFTSLVNDLAAELRRWTHYLACLEAKSKLMERGVEVSNSAFLEAVEKGDLGSCELFLQAGFSPDLTNKKGVSILCQAVRSAHLGVVRLLLEKGADINLRSRDRDNSPVMDAAAEGLIDIVRELIARGADLGSVSRNGQNALVLAIGKGAQDVAGLLLEAGGDPFVVDKLGMNAVQYAQLLGRKEFAAQVAQRFPNR